MPLNLHTFPLVRYPGLAPEAAELSGMGSWDPYALLAPADRLLPFVLTRTLIIGADTWVNCARIEHADTQELIVELTPTGPGVAVPSLGLLFQKYQDETSESFAYMGGTIPGLSLPCGTPLRLILDNVWQSPRFLARADVNTTCLLAEWSHPYPLYRVPYGTGLRQRFYVENGAVQFAPPTTKEEVQESASTGKRSTVFLAQARGGTLQVEAVPAYLAEALSATRAHKTFSLDGEEWTVLDAKDTKAGDDGGRDTFTLTLEQTDMLVRRNCPAPVPVALSFAPTMVRPYRCGDASDTAPDFQPDGEGICQLDNDDLNTGFVIYPTRDQNPNSASFGQVGAPWVSAQPNTSLCPVPKTYYSRKVSGFTDRNNCPEGQVSATQKYYEIQAGAYTSRVSQEAANQLALDAYAIEAQANANATGTCAVPGPGGTAEYVPVYDQGSGCFVCQMVNAADPGDVRDATNAEIAQYFRQFDNNGSLCTACLNT